MTRRVELRTATNDDKCSVMFVTKSGQSEAVMFEKYQFVTLMQYSIDKQSKSRNVTSK